MVFLLLEVFVLVHVSCSSHHNKDYTFAGRKRLLNLFTDALFETDSWRTEKAALLFIVPLQVGTLKSGIMSAAFFVSREAEQLLYDEANLGRNASNVANERLCLYKIETD